MTVVNDGAWVAAISESIGQPWHSADASDGCKLGFEMRVSTMRQFSWRLHMLLCAWEGLLVGMRVVCAC
jgi:hypothetical protein